MRLAAEELRLHRLHDLGHAGHAAHQGEHDDLRLLEAGVLQRLVAGPDRLGGEGPRPAPRHLARRDLDVEVQRARLVHRDERQVDLVLCGCRKFFLRFFCFLLQALQRKLVLAQVDALFLLELVGQVFDNPHVEVLASEEGVTVGGLHLEYAVADLEDRDVERAAAEVVDGDLPAFGLVQTIGDGRRGRFVDDAQDFQSGDLPGVLGGLTLGVVEVGRNGRRPSPSTFSPRWASAASFIFCGMNAEICWGE